MKGILFVCAAMLGLAAAPVHAQTLATVKARGTLSCGSHTGLAGFGLPDAQGNWAGLDVDFCRAVAATIFDDPKKVKFVPLTSKDRFTALQSGEVDVLARNTSWTSSRDTALGLNFTGVNYYDGQGFMVRKELKVKSALELSEAFVNVVSQDVQCLHSVSAPSCQLLLSPSLRIAAALLQEKQRCAASCHRNQTNPRCSRGATLTGIGAASSSPNTCSALCVTPGA